MKDKIRDRIFDEVNTIFLNYQEEISLTIYNSTYTEMEISLKN